MNWMVRIAAVVALLGLAGCIPQLMNKTQSQVPIVSGPATERQVESALQRYSGLLLAVDPTAVAQMYAPDGVWERQNGALHGREAIRDALASTGGIRVLSNEMTTAYLSYNGPAVVQTGNFKQSAKLPDGKIVNATGTFEATWVRSEQSDWWIRRMVTRRVK
ncbi:MAG: DUF4440 domain-containing protein [Alphaproteobacteria bacterium]|nr:DUF4440 domain-containing protein [Alphaproteobacteria bacterium]